MKRNKLLALLDDYQGYPEEDATKKEIITFIRQYEDCFERSLVCGHITASSWLLNKDQTHALLMHHAKLDMWVQLGGHCDGESDALSVAIKEAQEESGIAHIVPVSTAIFDIDIHLIPARKNEAAHYHYDIRFLLRVTEDVSFAGNHESHALRWVSSDEKELPTQEPSIVRMHHKWKTV